MTVSFVFALIPLFIFKGLLAVPLVGLYMGGAAAVRAIEQSRGRELTA
jgi:Sec-independent protein secretion pathway component TatC